MKCIHCETEIETDDNFCPKCGHWTIKGYSFLKQEENIKKIMNGASIKQNEKFSILMSLLSLLFILFIVIMLIRGEDLFKPFIYLKKQVTNYIYGYNTSIIKTDNKYNNSSINSYEEATSFIKKDFQEQSWLCEKNIDISKIEYELEENFNIPSVSFCDASYEVSKKLYTVITKMYNLFPNIKGSLTNITITNAKTSQYIAYFQPMYQFVNVKEDINYYNKINKTQILLNSYYFLNDEILNTNLDSIVGENWYVNGATWESTIAHELGHYISFIILLKEHNLENITYETKENYKEIENVINIFNQKTHSTEIVNEALANYNYKYNLDYDKYIFAQTISKYASSKDENGNLLADEVIAEAIHDYYLHNEEMKNSSREIIEIIKNKLS